MMPARRSVAKSCSRNCTGTWRRRASSPIGTGSKLLLVASSASASTAYGDLLVIEIIARDCRALRQHPIVVDLQPAALGGDQHGLGAVDGAELAVDVVQVGAHGARRERELVRDLLVDLAFGESLQHPQLAARERARTDVAPALDGGAGKLVHHAPELLRPEAHAARCPQQLTGRDAASLLVVREHVGQA